MVSVPISRSSHIKALWPGVKRFFGHTYSELPAMWSGMFDTESSDKAYEEYVQKNTLGLVPIKAEGAPTAYDGENQGYATRLTNVARSLGVIVTYEAMKDGQYEGIMFPNAERLAKAFARTKETAGAAVYNRAFNSSYTFGDGKELIATDHPSLVGNQANEPSVSVDLSEAALEDIAILIRKAVDNRGNRIALQPRKLIVSPDNRFEAERLLSSTLRPGTANNDVNAVNYQNTFPEGWMDNPYLTDADAWFVRTDAGGMIYQEREAISFEEDNDFDTKNFRAAAYERYAFGNTGEWRDLYGSEGA